MTIPNQRLGKHIPGVTLSTIGHPLLGNGPINTPSRTTVEKFFSVWSVPRNYKTVEFRS
jgi:hypothetical protein